MVVLAIFLAVINQVFSLLDPQIFRIIIDKYGSGWAPAAPGTADHQPPLQVAADRRAYHAHRPAQPIPGRARSTLPEHFGVILLPGAHRALGGLRRAGAFSIIAASCHRAKTGNRAMIVHQEGP
jgi:hypothetical protein